MIQKDREDLKTNKDLVDKIAGNFLESGKASLEDTEKIVMFFEKMHSQFDREAKNQSCPITSEYTMMKGYVCKIYGMVLSLVSKLSQGTALGDFEDSISSVKILVKAVQSSYLVIISDPKTKPGSFLTRTNDLRDENARMEGVIVDVEKFFSSVKGLN